MAIDYVGNGAPTIPVPPRGALYYDQVDGILYGSVPGLGEWFVIGGGSTGLAVPVIQASVQVVNATAPETLSITAAKTTLYALSVYMKSLGTAATGHTYVKTISYTAADGSGVQTVALTLPLDSPSVVMETYPILVLGGTPITTTGAYGGGAVNDPYTLSERIVEMP